MKKEQKELEAVEKEEEERRSAAEAKKETELRFRERVRRQKKKLEAYYASLREKAEMELYGSPNDSPLPTNASMSAYMEHDDSSLDEEGSRWSSNIEMVARRESNNRKMDKTSSADDGDQALTAH